MIKLLSIVGIVLTVNVQAAKFECKYVKGWDRPSNANAIKLATALKVKTCNSEKFVKYVKNNGHTMNALVRNSNGGVKTLKFK